MEKLARTPALTEGFCFLLLIAAFALIQILIAGMRMVFSLPAYALLGVLGLCAIISLRRVKPAASQLCLAVTAAFFAYILARAFLSPVPYIARSDIYSVLGGLVVYFFVACILTDARHRMLFVAALLVLAIGHVLVGAVQFRDGTNFMPISWLQRYDYDRRASGFYICPNHLAGLLEVLGIMGLSIVCWSRWPVWSKMLVAYAVGICYVGLILTGSRGGYLSTLFSLGVFAVLSLAILRRTGGGLFWKIGGMGCVAAISLGLAAFYFINKNDYLSGRAQQVFETTNMRIDLWKGALEQWKLQPIVGTGTGTYLYYGRFFRTDRVQRDPVYVHNDYLHLLAEYGLVGAAGMLLFVAVHLRYGGRNFVRLGPKRVAVSQRVLSNALALNVGAIAAVSSYVVHSVFDFNLHIPANVLLLAFVFGILANAGVERDREALSSPRTQMWWRMALPALGLLLIVQCIRLFPGEYYSELARIAVRDQRPALGILNALRGLQTDGQNPDLHHRLGAARMQLADRMEDAQATASFQREAIVAFERARALAPHDEIYALELASALDAARRFAEAEWIYYEAFRLDPKSDSLRRSYEGHLERWRRSGLPLNPPPEGASS